ncbi:hypothetical protein [Variovorax rhizosphaerae]|uniref:Uncharacterized protein n=1 Tax=Variovorax rhizosphaerae TaxID=1836200 RepID=A0ABU8WSA5_9BURK
MEHLFAPKPAQSSSEDNWLWDFENLSTEDAKFLEVLSQKEELVGELWRERLSSEPFALKLAAEAQARTGDPMAYYLSLARSYPTSVPTTPTTASSTLARLAQLKAEMTRLALASEQSCRPVRPEYPLAAPSAPSCLAGAAANGTESPDQRG